MINWPDLELPPINLWVLISAKDFYNMSGGIENWREEEHRRSAPHSEHYQKVKPEPIEVIEGWGLNFNLGQVIKYIGRHKMKGQMRSDLEKAYWYLGRELGLTSPKETENTSQAQMAYGVINHGV